MSGWITTGCSPPGTDSQRREQARKQEVTCSAHPTSQPQTRSQNPGCMAPGVQMFSQPCSSECQVGTAGAIPGAPGLPTPSCHQEIFFPGRASKKMAPAKDPMAGSSAAASSLSSGAVLGYSVFLVLRGRYSSTQRSSFCCSIFLLTKKDLQEEHTENLTRSDPQSPGSAFHRRADSERPPALSPAPRGPGSHLLGLVLLRRGSFLLGWEKAQVRFPETQRQKRRG